MGAATAGVVSLCCRSMAPSPEERLDRFVRLLVCHQGRLYQYVRMLTPRGADVEDILQQAFLVMWQKFDESYADASFYGWATRVAYLEVLKARSRGRRNLPLLDQEVLDKIVGEESEEPEFLANLKTLLDGCLKKLPPNDRELIERRYQPGVLVQRLAEELGRPVNSVSSSLAHPPDAVEVHQRGVCRSGRHQGEDAVMPQDWKQELDGLLERLIDGEFNADDRARLNAVLAEGREQRRYYRGYMRLHYGLEWRVGEPQLCCGLSSPAGQCPAVADAPRAADGVPVSAPPLASHVPLVGFCAFRRAALLRDGQSAPGRDDRRRLGVAGASRSNGFRGGVAVGTGGGPTFAGHYRQDHPRERLPLARSEVCRRQRGGGPRGTRSSFSSKDQWRSPTIRERGSFFKGRPCIWRHRTTGDFFGWER